MAVLTVTDAAREVILGMRRTEADGDQLALKVEILGTTGQEFTYDLTFENVDAATEAKAEVLDLEDKLNQVKAARKSG